MLPRAPSPWKGRSVGGQSSRESAQCLCLAWKENKRVFPLSFAISWENLGNHAGNYHRESLAARAAWSFVGICTTGGLAQATSTFISVVLHHGHRKLACHSISSLATASALVLQA